LHVSLELKFWLLIFQADPFDQHTNFRTFSLKI